MATEKQKKGKPKATPKKKSTKKRASKKPSKLPIYYEFGRPSKYRKKFCKKFVEYFDVPYFVEKEITKATSSGVIYKTKVQVPNQLPLIEGFARSINVDPDTIVNWTKKHPDFLGAYRKAKGLQKEMLVHMSINGHYQQSYAIFLSKNITDFRDRVETDVTSGGEKVESVNLTSFMENLKNKDVNDLRREANKQNANHRKS